MIKEWFSFHLAESGWSRAYLGQLWEISRRSLPFAFLEEHQHGIISIQEIHCFRGKYLVYPSLSDHRIGLDGHWEWLSLLSSLRVVVVIRSSSGFHGSGGIEP